LGAKPSPTEKSSPRLLWLRLGLALGITVLLRQVFLLFLPFLFGWLLWRCYQARARPFFQMISILSGATVILILMILPWTIRNYQAFNRFVLLNTNAGFAFYWGNHPVHGYDFISILPAGGPSYQSLIPKEYRRLDEAAMDQALLKDALTIIKNDPVRYAILSLSRFKDYFMFWPTPDSGLISNLSRVLSFGLLWPFMAYSFVRYAGGALRSEALLLYFFVMVYTLIHLLTWTLIRYRLPVDAVLLIFAALTIVEIANRIKQRRGKHERLYQPVLIRPEE
jgi:4-amino-4-deoxy-L-arabinose transferase-like glycosyltransferase